MTSDLSVLYVNPTKQLRTGIRSLSTGLSATVDATVLTPSDSKSRISEHSRVTYRYYNATYIPGIRYTLPTSSFLRCLSRQISRADLIHVYSYFYPVCVAAVLESVRLDTPSVVTVDSLPGVNWTSGNRLVDLIGRCYTSTLGRATFTAASHVVALGEYLIGTLEPYVSENKLMVIPNGIDTEKFTPSADESANDADTKDLLFVGRLDPVKGVPTLLYALNRLSHYSEKRYRLTIVGDGTKREEYQRLCTDLGIENRVTFDGYQENVVSYYRNHDLFVLPSFSEGQPTVLLEAQSCGLPVVATDVGGASEIVEVGETVPPNDYRALADAIDSFSVGHPDSSHRARSVVKRRYSMEKMCQKYLELYSELTNDE